MALQRLIIDAGRYATAANTYRRGPGGREKSRANDPPEAAGVKGERPGEDEKRKLYMPVCRTAVPVAPR